MEGYDLFIPAMANHPKDGHVLAAAAVCGAQTIVAPWNVEAQSPDEFLIHQYHLDPKSVIHPYCLPCLLFLWRLNDLRERQIRGSREQTAKRLQVLISA